MWAKSDPDGQQARSFIDIARRMQIVGAAIETIAEVGYGHASLARIAERLGISKGVISYHFAGKDELIREVVNEVYATAGAFVEPRLTAESSATGVLRAYIEGEIAFMRAHPAHLRAMVEIFTNHRTPEGKLYYDGVSEEEKRLVVEEILVTGQRNGEFREFPARIMAIAVSGAIDGVLLQWMANPDLDLELCGSELATVFHLATRRV